MKRAEPVAEHARLAEALERVVAPTKNALPANAKITAFVCSGRSRPYDSSGLNQEIAGAPA